MQALVTSGQRNDRRADLYGLRAYARAWRDGYVTGVTSDFAATAMEGLASSLLSACGVPVKRAREIVELAFHDVACEHPERALCSSVWPRKWGSRELRGRDVCNGAEAKAR
jgi:hypothetical protein